MASDDASGSDGIDMEFKRLVDSMHTMLGHVNNEIFQACSISVVPEQLQKSKVKAYTPRVVSIGPLFKGTSPDLIYMEDIKWRCMSHLLHRTQNVVASLEACSIAILSLDEIVRASYNVDDIKLNSYDLAKIMLVDGCFLLELLISRSLDLNTELNCNLSSISPGADVRKREAVLSDLAVLGNQIPFIIIIKLATLLFPDVFHPNEDGIATEDAMKKIKKLVLLSLLGYSSGRRINCCSDPFTF